MRCPGGQLPTQGARNCCKKGTQATDLGIPTSALLKPEKKQKSHNLFRQGQVQKGAVEPSYGQRAFRTRLGNNRPASSVKNEWQSLPTAALKWGGLARPFLRSAGRGSVRLNNGGDQATRKDGK